MVHSVLTKQGSPQGVDIWAEDDLAQEVLIRLHKLLLAGFRVTAIRGLLKNLAIKAVATQIRRVAPRHQVPRSELDVEIHPTSGTIELSEPWNEVFSAARKLTSADMKDYFTFRVENPEFSIALAEQEFHISNAAAKQRTKRVDDNIRVAHATVTRRLIRNIGDEKPSVTFEDRLRSQQVLRLLACGHVQKADFRICCIASFMRVMLRTVGNASDNYERGRREASRILYNGARLDPTHKFILFWSGLLLMALQNRSTLRSGDIDYYRRDYDAICFFLAHRFGFPVLTPLEPFNFTNPPASRMRKVCSAHRRNARGFQYVFAGRD